MQLLHYETFRSFFKVLHRNLCDRETDVPVWQPINKYSETTTNKTPTGCPQAQMNKVIPDSNEKF